MRKINRRLLRSIAVNITLILAIYLLVQAYHGRDAPHSGVAPNIEAVGLDGQKISLTDYQGQPVLIYFWATWCSVCSLTRDSINSIADDYSVITIASQSGSHQEISSYIQKHHFTPPVINDLTGQLSQTYGVRAFPSVYILNNKGEIVDVEIGLSSEWGLRFRLWWASTF